MVSPPRRWRMTRGRASSCTLKRVDGMRDSTVVALYKVIVHFDMTISDTVT
jgi:hypothetical protein